MMVVFYVSAFDGFLLLVSAACIWKLVNYRENILLDLSGGLYHPYELMSIGTCFV